MEFIRVQTAEFISDAGFKAVKDTNGKEYTMWPKDRKGNDIPGYNLVVPGAQIDVEIKTNTKDGKVYNNIMQAQVHEGIAQLPVMQPSLDPTQDSIERQVCLKAAVELVVGTSVEGMLTFNQAIDDAVEAAKKFFAWLQGQSPTETPELPEKQASEPPRGTIDNAGKFLAMCHVTWEMNKSDVEELLGQPVSKVKDYEAMLDTFADHQGKAWR